MVPLYILMVVASIILGLILIAIGAYLWLAIKKMIAGIVLAAVGLLLTLVPIGFIAFFAITASVRG